MEAEEEAISSGLPALEEQERRQSAPAELLLDGGSIADSSPTQTSSTPADPAAAASPGNGGASAGSPEQSPSQVRGLPPLSKCRDRPGETYGAHLSPSSALKAWQAQIMGSMSMRLCWSCIGGLHDMMTCMLIQKKQISCVLASYYSASYVKTAAANNLRCLSSPKHIAISPRRKAFRAG